MGPGQRLLGRRCAWATLVAGALAFAALGQDAQPALSRATRAAATEPTPTTAPTTQAATSESTTTPAAEWELPADVRAVLAQTQDFAFNFDQPGFYAVLRHVKRDPRSPGAVQPPIEVRDWRDLLERPNDFRGRPVTVEGAVGRNKNPYRLTEHPELGQLTQLELRRADQPIICTLILTEGAGDLPLDATVQVTGYFVMIRQYHGSGNRVQQAALIVAPGPTSMSWKLPPPATTEGPDWRWMVGAVAVGVVITVVLLRRTAGGLRHDVRELRARRAAPVSLADDLADWAEQGQPGASADRGTAPGSADDQTE